MRYPLACFLAGSLHHVQNTKVERRFLGDCSVFAYTASRRRSALKIYAWCAIPFFVQDGEPATADPHGAHGDGQAGGRLRRVRVGVQSMGRWLGVVNLFANLRERRTVDIGSTLFRCSMRNSRPR